MADRQPFNPDTHSLKATRAFQRGTVAKAKGEYLTRKEVRQLGPEGIAAVEDALGAAERVTWATADKHAAEAKPGKPAKGTAAAPAAGGTGTAGTGEEQGGEPGSGGTS